MDAKESSLGSEPPIVEQVINEFFAKSLHIILESRSPYVSSRNFTLDRFSPSPSSPSPVSSPLGSRPRDKWFNLALRDCPAALENCDLWRESYREPLIIDVILTERSRILMGKEQLRTEKIIERWTVQYESRKVGSVGNSSGSHSGSVSKLYKKTYNELIIFFRSLYLVVRLLPAYGLFCDLNSSGQIHALSLSHRISSPTELIKQAGELSHFSFVPIDTLFGRLSVSVSYTSSLELVPSEPLTPISAEVIPDYVGSPTIDRLKKFNSLPSDGFSYPRIFVTRHSWSSEQEASSISQSPSPTYSEPCALHFNRNVDLPPRNRHGNYWQHTENTILDGRSHTPTVSPIASPCTPVNRCSQYVKDLPKPQIGSAPVGIPVPCSGRGRGNDARSDLSGSSQSTTPGCQVVSANSNNDLQSKNKELVRYRGFQIGKALQPVLPHEKYELGPFCGLKFPSRIVNRLPPLDDFDDLKFVFTEDDKDITRTCRRIEYLEDKGQKEGGEAVEDGGALALQSSPDAVAGALIHMLKIAAPLRPTVSKSSRTIADALSELKVHKATKDSIENQGNR